MVIFYFYSIIDDEVEVNNEDDNDDEIEEDGEYQAGILERARLINEHYARINPRQWKIPIGTYCSIVQHFFSQNTHHFYTKKLYFISV